MALLGINGPLPREMFIEGPTLPRHRAIDEFFRGRTGHADSRQAARASPGSRVPLFEQARVERGKEGIELSYPFTCHGFARDGAPLALESSRTSGLRESVI
jgi:hypothetical protein